MHLFRRLLPLLMLWPLGALADPVNINSADAATLARELVGIGDAKAAAIVAHRREHGPFRSIEDLALVKGIGPQLIERNRANLRVGPAAPAAAPRGPDPRAGAQVPGRGPTGAAPPANQRTVPASPR